jgi:hypothetical protein
VTDLPQPTDDELLLAFVEDCPSMAVDNYRRRVGINWYSSYLFEHLKEAWHRRMYDKGPP